MPEPESYPESQARVMAFHQLLSQLGWTVGQTLVIDYRWEISSSERSRSATAEFLGLAPDVILAVGSIHQINNSLARVAPNVQSSHSR